MFFYVSKLLWILTAPTNALLFLLGLAFVFGMTRFQIFGRRLAAVAAIALLAIGFLPLGTLALRPLEDRFPQAPADLPPPTGIIVLGGSTDEVVSAARGQATISGAATRITSAVALARRFPTARLVFSGGSGAMILKPRTEAEITKSLWIDLGIPADRIATEDRSRNTDENALFTRRLLDPKPGERWLLVTSAFHMPRAVGLFRAVGMSVIPYPVDYRTTGTTLDLLPSMNAADGLDRFDRATREWIGLAIYRLTGRIDTLWPDPTGS